MSPATPDIAPPPRWLRLRWTLKAAYALLASAFSVWVASFAPAGGPPIAACLPADTVAILQVRNGAALARRLFEGRHFAEARQDHDVNALWGLNAKLADAEQKLRELPASVQQIFPIAWESLDPLAGDETAVAWLREPAHTTGKRRPFIVFTRLQGSRGHLVRLAASFAKLPRRMQFADLGGGLVAIGFDGALPVPAGQAPVARDAALAWPPDAPPDARLIVFQAVAAASPEASALTQCPQYEMLAEQGVPDWALRAILHPPGVPAMLGVANMPGALRLDFRVAADGLAARGRLSGKLLPPAPTPPLPTPPEPAFAEGLLPLDLRACFLRDLANQMRLHPDRDRLTTRQRRWVHRFGELATAGVDLERDLWPACGAALHVRIQSDPLDTAGYGLVLCAAPFDGARPHARAAFGELIRQRWNGDLYDGVVPFDCEPPYVKRIQEKIFDRYLLNTGQLTVPSWTAADHGLVFASNVGPYALRNPARLPPPLPPRESAAPTYFLRLDGGQLAPTVERLTTLDLDEREQELGTQEFLAQYPDAALYVRVAGKLARLLGRVELTVRPDPDGAGVSLLWVPGALAAPEPPAVESVPAPPPPP